MGWQTGYTVVSFGTKDLEWVVDYNRKGTAIERLEKITHDEDDES